MSNRNNYTQKAMRNLRHADGSGVGAINDAIDVRVGLDKTFGFSVQNPSTTNSITVALLPGHYDTSSYTIEEATDGGNVIKSLSNPNTLVAAGYPCDCVIDDGNFTLPTAKGGLDVVMQPNDSRNTIRSFRDFLFTNPLSLRGLSLVTSDEQAFDGSLLVTNSSPFDRGAERTIQLNDFLSAFQYRGDRARIDFSQAQLELSDITMLFVTIPAAATITFFLRF